MGERGDLFVGPQAEVAIGDATFGRDGGRLEDDEAEAAEREPAQVREVPVIGHAVDGRILAHGRHDGAVAQREAAQVEW